jgi:hypothetical protein
MARASRSSRIRRAIGRSPAAAGGFVKVALKQRTFDPEAVAASEERARLRGPASIVFRRQGLVQDPAAAADEFWRG